MESHDIDTQSNGGKSLDGQTALITGASKRIGAAITRILHEAGANVVLHYRSSAAEADALACSLESARPNSTHVLQADLLDTTEVEQLANRATAHWGRLDILVNNASAFYPTPVGTINEQAWEELVHSNLKAPLFLSQACANALRTEAGCIINLADIHGESPLAEHTIYCVAKAGLIMLTKSLARELAPSVRVNAIAPGAILPPPGVEQMDDAFIEKIPLKRVGGTDPIAETALFLAHPDSYITGQVVRVDGGISL
ncbi:MAG: pteridine reductase [Pseudomonadota bacterium]